MALRIKTQISDGFDERWFEYQDGISFKIAPINNENYQIGLERARRLIDRKESRLDLHKLEVDSSDRSEIGIQSELAGRYLIKDWKGEIFDNEGNQVPYTPDNAQALLLSEPSLISWVILRAAEVAADLAKEQEDIVGKPLSASNGSGSGANKLKSES